MVINALNRARTCSWPISKIRTRPLGRICSKTKSTCAMPCGERSTSSVPKASRTASWPELQRCSCGREAGIFPKNNLLVRRRALAGLSSTSSVRLSQRERTDSSRQRPYFNLPKMESISRRGLERCLHRSATRARRASRHDQSHCAHRNGARRFRDARVLYELKGPFRRLNIGVLGLHFQLHQEIRGMKSSVWRPRAGDDDAPFMRAYALLLVKTCHARGHMRWRMAAQIPIRNDAAANAAA